MISDSMADGLNAQFNRELYAGYLYLAMSLDAAHKGWQGAAAWFAAQSREELGHALKFKEQVSSRGIKARLEELSRPPDEFQGLRAMFEGALQHEQFVSDCITKLMDQARSENDYATEVFLQWFVAEQVEEEESVQQILDRLDLAGDAVNSLFMLDRELAARGRDG